MIRTYVPLLAAIALSCSCASSSAPARARPPVAVPAPSLPERAAVPHVAVTMPPGWKPVDLSNVQRGDTVLSYRNGSRIQILHDVTAHEPSLLADALAEVIQEHGYACSPASVSADRTTVSFRVSLSAMRGKIVIRLLSKGGVYVLAVGQWPQEDDAEGVRAVDAVIASAVYE